MLRKEREITDYEEILAVLEKCDTITLGLKGTDYPYVVPLSFGTAKTEGGLAVYFHGAKRGQKVDMFKSQPHVCFEGHIFHKVEPTQYGITTRYESVIGLGKIEEAVGDEIVFGLQKILDHYKHTDYPIGRCKGLPATAVYKIVVESLTGKRNIAE